MRHELFAADELAPEESRAVQIGRISVLVVRAPDGSFRALRNVCPHLGVPLSRGSLERVVAGNGVGDYEITDRLAARCSWHGFEFSIDSGKCVADSRWRVRTYPVEVVDGVLVLER